MTPSDLAKYEKEFAVKREDWSKYESPDGTMRFWIRTVLTKAYLVPAGVLGAAAASWATGTQNIVTAFFPADKQGKPNGPHPKDSLTKGGVHVDFQTLDEPWNEYLVPGSPPRLLRTRVIAAGIRVFFDKFNDSGDPVVNIDSQVVVSNPIDLPDP